MHESWEYQSIQKRIYDKLIYVELSCKSKWLYAFILKERVAIILQGHGFVLNKRITI